MAQEYSLTRDPIYFITVGLFAILTTAMPTLLGQIWFLPLIQSFALFMFLILPLRQQDVTMAAIILTLWLMLQFVVVAGLTSLAITNVDQAIPDGFVARGETLAWIFGATTYPFGIASRPLVRFGELAGVIIGSAMSAGLVGAWFLVRATNFAAFETGVLISGLDGSVVSYLLALLPWNLLRIASYASLLLLFSQFILQRQRFLTVTMRDRRKIAIAAVTLFMLALLSEWTLPGLWQWLARSGS